MYNVYSFSLAHVTNFNFVNIFCVYNNNNNKAILLLLLLLLLLLILTVPGMNKAIQNNIDTMTHRGKKKKKSKKTSEYIQWKGLVYYQCTHNTKKARAYTLGASFSYTHTHTHTHTHLSLIHI